MEVGQGPNWGCSAKEKKNLDGRYEKENERKSRKKQLKICRVRGTQ
jgi:hypothetical protein